MSEPESDTLWFVSPIEREAYEKLQAENERLREALRRIRDEGPSAPVAHGIARAALGDTEHE